MKSLPFRFILIIFFSFSATSVFGQTKARKNVDQQQLMWFRYFNKLTFSDRWQVNTQFEERAFFAPWKQHTFVSRIQLIYKLNSTVSVSQGFVNFLQSPHDPESPSKFVVPELRPYQEVIIKNDMGKKLKVTHRYKIEERFFKNNDPKTEQLLSGYTFNFRVRYLFQVQLPLFNLTENKPLRLVLSDEIMVNFGESIVNNAFDQNRFTAGLAYDLNKNFGLEIDYINWFQQRASGKDYYNRHITRFTLYHNIDLSKKKEKEPAKN